MQGSFFGNTRASPIRTQGQQHSLGLPAHRPLWGTDHSMCSANRTPFIILFFKSHLPNCSVSYSYGRASLSLPYYRTAQPQIYKPPGPLTGGDATSPYPGPLGQPWHRCAGPGVRVPPPLVEAAPCQAQAVRLLQISISAPHLPILTLQHFPNALLQTTEVDEHLSLVPPQKLPGLKGTRGTARALPRPSPRAGLLP